MDLIVKLPKTERGHNSMLVFVDRLSKMVHLVPTVEALSATGFARLFRDWIIRLHEMPDSVLSDRGPQFNNLFWEQVNKLTGMTRSSSEEEAVKCVSSADRWSD